MIYFTRHEQRIIILLGIIMLLGTGVLLAKRFQPGWIMRLSMGKPDFDVKKDQVSPRLKSAPPEFTDQATQEQQSDQNTDNGKPVPTDQPVQKQPDQDYRSEKAAENPLQKPKININTASKEDLENLPGVGPVLAQRIIDYRQEHGKFAGVDSLTNVRGIGDLTLQKVKDLVTTGDYEKGEQ